MVIFVVDPSRRPRAEALAKRLSLRLVEELPVGYYLTFEGDRLVVKDPRQGAHFAIKLDIKKEMARIQSQKISPKKDLLARAVGLKTNTEHIVFDGTLGFGKDAFHLLAMGCKVVGCEVNPITHALMEDAIFSEPEEITNFTLLHGETSDFLEEYSSQIDCLYLDPMFEDVKRKSAPKKQMAFLREIAMDTVDVQRVMEQSHTLEIKRMVVKRPIHSKYLLRKPNITYEGNLIRYDVYTR